MRVAAIQMTSTPDKSANLAEAHRLIREAMDLGAELVEVVRGQVATRRATFRVGVVGTLPKTTVCRMMEPAFSATTRPLVPMRQDGLETLMRLLAANRLHLILSNSPPPAGLRSQLHSHPLGETGIVLYGTPALAEKYRPGFPSSLENARCYCLSVWQASLMIWSRCLSSVR